MVSTKVSPKFLAMVGGFILLQPPCDAFTPKQASTSDDCVLGRMEGTLHGTSTKAVRSGFDERPDLVAEETLTEARRCQFSGKYAIRRRFYSLSHGSIPSNGRRYALEERLRYRILDDGQEFELLDMPKTFRVLTEDVSEDHESQPHHSRWSPKPICRMDLHEIRAGRVGGGSRGSYVWDACLVGILFVLSNPHLQLTNLLDLGSGVGLGGLLTCAARSGMPATTQTLTLADREEKTLGLAQQNLDEMSRLLEGTEVQLQQLDWKVPVEDLPSNMKHRYDFILAADIVYQFPDVRYIARTVAHCLRPKTMSAANEVSSALFVGPENRGPNIQDMKNWLERGYRMDVDKSDITLERHEFSPLILESLQQEEDDLNVGAVQRWSLEERIVSIPFVGLMAQHTKDYDGFNGQELFPAENGEL